MAQDHTHHGILCVKVSCAAKLTHFLSNLSWLAAHVDAASGMVLDARAHEQELSKPHNALANKLVATPCEMFRCRLCLFACIVG